MTSSEKLINEIYVNSIAGLMERALLWAVVINLTAVAIFWGLGNLAVSISLPIIVLSICYLVAYWTQTQKKYLATSIISFGSSMIVIAYFAITMPWVKLESLLFISLSIFAFVFIPYKRWRRLFFVFNISLCFLLQGYESFFQQLVEITAEQALLNKVVIFIIISYIFMNIVIMGLAFDWYLKDLLKKEEKLARSKLKYQNLVEVIPSAIVIVDVEGNSFYTSPAACKIFGYPTLRDFPSTNIFDYCTPDSQRRSKRYVRALKDPNSPRTIILEGIHPKGHIFYFEVSGRYIYNKERQKDQYILIYSDVTARHEAQQEVEERKLIYETLIGNSFDGIDIIELVRNNGHTQGKLLSRNQKSTDVFDGSTSPLVELKDLLVLSPEYQPNGQKTTVLFKYWLKQLFQKGFIEHDWQVQHANGRLFDLEVTTQIVLINKKQIVIRIYRDVTENKKQAAVIQQQMETLNTKNQELQKYIDSNMQLENFAYIASHDLQSPLRTVISFTQLLRRSLKNKLTERELEYMEFIISGSLNMKELINALLSFSRANTTKLSLKTVNIPRLLEEIIFDLGSTISEKQATVNLENLPTTIKADRLKLKQLFQNLITNAFKFVAAEKRPCVTISGEDKANYWQFSVEDNGIGIAPQFQEKIFLLFKRLHTSQVYEGTGIGLALCKKLVDQHEGKIWVESTLGEGSTFYFTISKSLSSVKSREIVKHL